MTLISAGRYDPNNLVLGRGVVYFGQHDPATHKPLFGYRDLGNATGFTAQAESTDLEHKSSRQSVQFTDRSVQLSQKFTLGITLDEPNFDNLALWGAGTVTTVAGYNGVAVASHDPIGGFASFVGGRWYDLHKTISPVIPGGGTLLSPFEDRIYDIGAVTVSVGAVNTDWIIDYKMGRIFVVKGGLLDLATTANVVINVATSPDASYEECRLFTGQSLRGSVKFIQVNPSNSDQLIEFEFHSVQLKPTGTMNFIGDAWEEMQFTGVAERNTAMSAASPTATIRTFSKAQGSVPD